MSPVKSRTIELSVLRCGLALLALAILMFFMLIPLPHAIDEEVFGKTLLNLLHVPLFAGVTILLRFFQTSS